MDEMKEFEAMLNELDKELKKKGLSRRDALKLMGLGSFALMTTPTNSHAMSKKIDGGGVRVAIAGGGAAGCTMANFIDKNIENAKITIIEPDTKSVTYQPGQTLIGGGIWTKDEIIKESKDFFPKNATWIQDVVTEFNPDNNFLKTSKNGTIEYDYLIVATGITLNYEGIEGLSKDKVGKNGVSSIYFLDGSVKTWEQMQEFIKLAKNKSDLKGIFTQPSTPIKCGGAPKKIMFLTHARLRDAGLRDKVRLDFYPASGNFFGTKEYNDASLRCFKERDMFYHFKNNLIAINTDSKIATFKKENGDTFDENYDFIHITPPMQAPKALAESNLASSKGWADTDKFTLQHVKYPNVFCLGDSSNLPTSKTGAGIREQYKVAGKNLISAIEQKELKEKYDGYTACPMITDIGKVLMAEFDYDNNPKPSLPLLDLEKDRWLWWMVKVYMLKPMYFHGMLKARA